MADEDDEIIVSLPADTSETKVVKAGDDTKKPPASADDAVADLKSQFAAMTGRVATAEATARTATQHAQAATQRVEQMQGEVVSSQLDTVLTGISAAETEANAAEAALAIAIEAGDAAAQARANRAIATATSRLQRLTEAKEELEETVKTTAKKPPLQQHTPRQPPSDPVDAFTQGMSSRSAAWVRAHPECVTDRKLNARMLAAHNLALADDIAVDSDEYFERIEAGIKPTGSVEKKSDAKPAGDGRRPSSAAASATGGGSSSDGVEVRLTKREATSATDGTLVWNYPDPTGQNRWQKGDPIGLKEMARRKVEGMKNGLYDKLQYEA